MVCSQLEARINIQCIVKDLNFVGTTLLGSKSSTVCKIFCQCQTAYFVICRRLLLKSVCLNELDPVRGNLKLLFCKTELLQLNNPQTGVNDKMRCLALAENIWHIFQLTLSSIFHPTNAFSPKMWHHLKANKQTF